MLVDWSIRRSDGPSSSPGAGSHTSTCIDRAGAIRQPRDEMYLVLSREPFLATQATARLCDIEIPWGPDESQEKTNRPAGRQSDRENHYEPVWANSTERASPLPP